MGRKRHLSRLALALIAGATTCFADPPAWQVSDGQGNTLWLLGSVHYLRAEDHPLPALVDELYGAASALVLELDLDDLDPIETQASLLAAATLPQGTTLEQVLGAELWAALSRAMEDIGLPAQSFSGFEPWFAALTLFDVGMLQAGFGPGYGLEQTLLRSAQRDRRPVMGLETLEQQLDVFDGLPALEQRRLLEQTLREIEVNAAAVAELVGAWRDGDLAALESALLAEMGRSPELYEALVGRRNRQWIDRISSLLQTRQTYLVVVGALHLVGTASLIELLENEGYELTRIMRAPN